MDSPQTPNATGWQKDGSYVPCPSCLWEPKKERHPGPGVPIRMPGTTHHGDCPTIPHLSYEEETKLRAKLAEMDRVRSRAEAESRNFVIG